jgi:hypothetical protein
MRLLSLVTRSRTIFLSCGSFLLLEEYCQVFGVPLPEPV